MSGVSDRPHRRPCTSTGMIPSATSSRALPERGPRSTPTFGDVRATATSRAARGNVWGPSQVPGQPWATLAYMPRSTIKVGDAIETAALGRAGRASSHPVAFAPLRSLGTYFVPNFGTQSRGLHARCLRFEITVTRGLPYDLARLAPGVAVSVVAGRIFAPGHASKFRAATCFLSDQACPGALKDQVNVDDLGRPPSALCPIDLAPTCHAFGFDAAQEGVSRPRHSSMRRTPRLPVKLNR